MGRAELASRPPRAKRSAADRIAGGPCARRHEPPRGRQAGRQARAARPGGASGEDTLIGLT
eukprot:9493932-Pyramimonas_sp.AAC.1